LIDFSYSLIVLTKSKSYYFWWINVF